MVDERVMKQARSVYNTVCKTLEDRNWRFMRDDEKMRIECKVRGDDLAMPLDIRVLPEREVVVLHSPMPFNMAEDKRIDGAIAVSVANYGLVDGSFDYDLSDGEIRFRMATSFRESILSEDVFDYMIGVTLNFADIYNDKFLALSTGTLSIEQFIEWEHNR